MKHPFPQYFKSSLAWEVYRQCLEKIQIGDEIQISIVDRNPNVSPDLWFPVIAIYNFGYGAYEYHRELTIGSLKSPHISGWSLNVHDPICPSKRAFSQIHPNWQKFVVNWNVYLPQTKVLKIRKNSNEPKV